MSTAEFQRSVFVNCPFDSDYDPILQAILFCLVYFGFVPRIATERTDSAESRLEKIIGLIESSRYSIHDLSRCQSSRAGEFYRLNTPFELGIDFACRLYRRGMGDKRILILEEESYRYQAALSDIAGFDIQSHNGDYQAAVRKVRNWLVNEGALVQDGATRILNAYTDFQAWYYRSRLDAGFSEEDIQDYPTRELLDAMKLWLEQGKPLT